jgi:NADH:ubiquinone oxidoreductase subunit E
MLRSEDIVRDVQEAFGRVPDETVAGIAAHLKLSEAEVRP